MSNYYIDHHPNTSIWIIGDVNLPNINWEANHANGSAYPIDLYEIIIDFTLEHGFIQSVDSATRKNNFLDVFFTNRPSLINTCHIVPGISDHEAVLIKSSITLTPQLSKLRKVIQWNKANIESIKETMHQFSNEFLTSYLSLVLLISFGRSLDHYT